jgi:hypothetical protein
MRRRSRPHTFEERLAEQKAHLVQEAARLNPGPEHDNLLKRIRLIDTAFHIDEWLNSPGLQPPK